MSIKETALQLAHRKCTSYEHVPVDMGIRYSFSDAHLIDFAEALVAELAKENKPVYAFRRKGLNNFCTCDKRRYNELVQKPALFEVRVFYTLPPNTADIEQRVAEACRKMAVSWGNARLDDNGGHALRNFATAVEIEEWREYL